MSDAKLLVDCVDGVVTLSLNRPDKLNAIDNDLSQSLLNALDDAAQNTAVRVVLLSGNGSAFCAGRDVTHAPTEDDLVLVQAVARAIVGPSLWLPRSTA